MQQLSEEDKKLSEYIRAVFEESFKSALPALGRMEKMQKAYECQIPETWATFSQIYLPYLRTAVEQALPNMMNYLFPPGGLISLTPKTPMPYEAVKNVRNYLEDLVTHQICLKQNGLLTLKDAMKFNVGYGIVETEIITPLDSVMNTIFGGDQPVEVKMMELGAPREVIKYNYVNWRCVIPTPDGDNPDDVSGVFHLHPMREDTFLQMYELDKTRDNPTLKGDPKKIVQNVRDEKCSMAHYPIWWVMNQFSGSSNVVKNMKALNEINKIVVNKKAPVVVPILKCYFKNEHIWMTPDGTVIYHIKDSVQTLRCPIIRACPVPDGGNWFPVGDVEASRDAADGANAFKNAMMDILSGVLHPTTIVNRMVVQDENVSLEPYSVVNVHGKVGDAISYAAPPQLPNGILGIGDELETQVAVANGQPRQFQGQGTAGIVRGGAGAFESLLQTTQARSKLAGAVLEMGWLQRVVDDTLILSQVLGLDDTYIVGDDASKSYIEKTITANELRNTFLVKVNLDDKFRKTPSDRAMDMALYRDVIRGNPDFNQQAAGEWILGDCELARKLLADPQTRQAQIQQMQQMAAAQQQEQGGGLNPGEQAMQGGASQAGGMV